MRSRILLLSTAIVLGGVQGAAAADWNALVAAGGESANWLIYGGNLANTRFVPNDEINVDNVGGLDLQWIFQTGIIGSFENTPVVEDSVMYITAPYNHVFAIDARSGRELWHYEHKLGTTIFCCGPNNRGVALADDKVCMATLDAMLVALDNRTGELVWETEIADPEFGYSETLAPSVYQDKIILGISGAEYPGEVQWGNVTTVNVDTAEIVWEARTEDPMIGGALATVGNLVFAGEGKGSFNAYDATTGDKLWSFQAGAGVNSAPMAFEVDGQLHIAVAAGGNFQLNYKLGDAILVFALD
jgi:glucose dehydrogenase